jgi:FKBP-type peptidyl-prolyl cis-trans isomerase FklB
MTMMSLTVCFSLAALLCAAPFTVARAQEVITDPATESYSVGFQVGSDFRRQGVDIDPEIVLRGVLDAMEGEEPLMDVRERRDTLTELQIELADARRAEKERTDRENLEKGKVFLTENAKREKVVTLPSGLQYEVIAEGEGPSPMETDTVTVHYRGTLIDGTEFDSSYTRGKPATFNLDHVIGGWTEGLQLMKPGAKYRLFIPPDLAYGNRGAGSKIGANSTLIFEVELLSVEGK